MTEEAKKETEVKPTTTLAYALHPRDNNLKIILQVNEVQFMTHIMGADAEGKGIMANGHYIPFEVGNEQSYLLAMREAYDDFAERIKRATA